MQHPWTMEFNGSYHREQLLAEAARERLATQAQAQDQPTPASDVRPERRANGQWMLRRLLEPIMAVLALKGGA